jgi:hypothetical protein
MKHRRALTALSNAQHMSGRRLGVKTGPFGCPIYQYEPELRSAGTLRRYVSSRLIKTPGSGGPADVGPTVSKPDAR